MDSAGDVPSFPAGLSTEDLRRLYRLADPQLAAEFGIEGVDLSEWPRWRKYAYFRYWQDRIQDRRPLQEDEFDEWQAFLAAAFMDSVAWGIVGDAARRNLLSGDQIRRLQVHASLNAYASRQLAARALLQSGSAQIVDQLLNLKAPWALHELLETHTDDVTRAALSAGAEDARISRRDRHALREALRHNAGRR